MRAWQATVQDEAGNAVFNPQVAVYQEDGSTLADIFNEDGSSKENPFIGTTEGFAQFWAERGTYKVVGANGGVSEAWQVDLADKAALELAEDVAQTQDRRDFGKWHLVDYLHPDDMAAALEGNVSGQDESRVTAAIQQMHDDFMDWWAGGSERRGEIVYPPVILAVNDELFSESFAQKLWDMSNATNQRNKCTIIATGTDFAVKNWSGRAAVRTSGLYAERGIEYPVPKVVFRWEQRSGIQIFPSIKGLFTITGNFDHATDPVGMKLRLATKPNIDGIQIRRFRNHNLIVEGMMNGKLNDLHLYYGGFQPTEWGGETGHMPTAVRFNNTGAVVTASAPVFDASHVGRMFSLSETGPIDTTVRINTWSEIVSVDSATQITLAEAPTINANNRVGSFEAIRASGAAGSPTITMSASLSADMSGRYVTIIGADYMSTPGSRGCMTAVVVSHSGDQLVLSQSPRDDFEDKLLVFSPLLLVDSIDGETLENGRSDNIGLADLICESSTWSTTACVPAVIGNAGLITMLNAKLHGTGSNQNNYGGSAAGMICGHARGLIYDGSIEQCTHSPRWGMTMFVGSHNMADLRGKITAYAGDDKCALVYVDSPLAPTIENVGISINFGLIPNGPRFPQDSQVAVRYGPNGREGMVRSYGSGREMYLGAPVAPTVLGKVIASEVAGNAVLQTLQDRTEGRLVTTRSFGMLGATQAPQPLSGARPDDLITAGRWRISSDDQMPTLGGYILETLVRFDTQVVQEAHLLLTARPTIWRRVWSSGWRPWMKYQLVWSGSTGNRPTDVVSGDLYFDTTLGHPIWWNGSAWVDATGTTV